MKKCISNLPLQKQRGAALIVSLVILVVITLIGVASMQSSTMEMKMTNSQKDRDAAFAAAEAGITVAEDWLELNKPAREVLWNACSLGDRCFEATCSGGLCFEGLFSNVDDEIDCVVGDGVGATERKEFWRDASLDVWDTDAKHQKVAIDGMDEDVKFIVEFLCFVAVNSGVPFDAITPGAENSGEPLYRITSLAQGNNDRAQVMLQSTYLLVE